MTPASTGRGNPQTCHINVEEIKSLGGTFDFTLTFDDGTISVNVSSNVPATDHTEAPDRTEKMDMTGAFGGKYSVSGDKLKITVITDSSKIDSGGRDEAGITGRMGMDEGEHAYTCSSDRPAINDQELTKKK